MNKISKCMLINVREKNIVRKRYRKCWEGRVVLDRELERNIILYILFGFRFN